MGYKKWPPTPIKSEMLDGQEIRVCRLCVLEKEGVTAETVRAELGDQILDALLAKILFHFDNMSQSEFASYLAGMSANLPPQCQVFCAVLLALKQRQGTA
jgi:hypothetical protein